MSWRQRQRQKRLVFDQIPDIHLSVRDDHLDSLTVLKRFFHLVRFLFRACNRHDGFGIQFANQNFQTPLAYQRHVP